MSGDSNAAKVQSARDVVGWYTLVAGGTGAIPVPASSAAIIANNGFMIAHVGAVMGTEVSWAGVASSLSVAGSLNIIGRTVFIEGAKALSWGTGSVWALAALSGLGATTASLQTYVIGLLAIEICKNGGRPIPPETAARIFDAAKATLGDFVSEMKEKKLANPGKPSVEAQERVEKADV